MILMREFSLAFKRVIKDIILGVTQQVATPDNFFVDRIHFIPQNCNLKLPAAHFLSLHHIHGLGLQLYFHQ